MTRVRCAIYTRKSSEEGLEQGFNSLDAQREACAAYILSQASEGWQEFAQVYDDGGLSGGTLERPALQRLLTDIAAGKVDIIVVYKVDRLTRSLLDFAQLVERFDRANVSFVSVTQSFNTTTSMGRLTLNMLLSFAQFEREVTAERIRDKIAASKARGMWMGGTPPVGYRPDGRSLAPVEQDAELVRLIFARYLDLGSVRQLADELARQGITTPQRTRARSGSAFGGRPFSRGQLYALLRNPIYIGRIPHRGTTYAGQHPPIIPAELWQAVQERLAANVNGVRQGRIAGARLLQGLVTDAAGVPLTVSHASKGKVRYYYYVSKQPETEVLGGKVNAAPPQLRLPAREIEQAVSEGMATLLSDPLTLAHLAGLTVAPHALAGMERRASELAARVQARVPVALRSLLTRVIVHSDRVTLELAPGPLASALGLEVPRDPPPPFRHELAVRLTRTGRAMRLVQNDGASLAPAPEADTFALVRLLAKARQWWKLLGETGKEIKVLAACEGVTASYMTRVVRLAFLSPQVIEAALTGRLRAGVDAAALLAPDSIPADWSSQEQRFLPRPAG